MNFKGLKVAIIGAGISGVGAARLLLDLGSRVSIFDTKDFDQLCEKSKEFLRDHSHIKYVLGKQQVIEDFIDQDLVVISPAVPYNSNLISSIRSLGIPVIGELSLACSLWKGNIIAVTGTNGKSTTATLISAILNKANIPHVLAGNIGVSFCDFVLEGENDIVAVLEVSSFQLEAVDIKRGFYIKPKIGIWLNLAPDHIDRHPSLEEYGKIKGRLFKEQDERDWAILNANDKYVVDLTKDIKSKKLYFDSLNPKGSKELYLIDDNHIAINIPDCKNLIIDLSNWHLLGRHNIENLMAAVGSSIIIGADCEAVNEAIKDFKPLSHRITFIGEKNKVKFIDDSKATNVAAALTAINAVNGSNKRNIVLIAGGLGKGEDYSPLLNVVDKLKAVILLGEERLNMAKIFSNLTNVNIVLLPEDLSNEECNLLEVGNYSKKIMEFAVKKAFYLSEEGDVILLSPCCASFDLFGSYAERGDVFKQAVNALIFSN